VVQNRIHGAGRVAGVAGARERGALYSWKKRTGLATVWGGRGRGEGRAPWTGAQRAALRGRRTQGGRKSPGRRPRSGEDGGAACGARMEA
jgi:hypothetical protein